METLPTFGEQAYEEFSRGLTDEPAWGELSRDIQAAWNAAALAAIEAYDAHLQGKADAQAEAVAAAPTFAQALEAAQTGAYEHAELPTDAGGEIAPETPEGDDDQDQSSRERDEEAQHLAHLEEEDDQDQAGWVEGQPFPASAVGSVYGPSGEPVAAKPRAPESDSEAAPSPDVPGPAVRSYTTY